jgi:hypothetical protein
MDVYLVPAGPDRHELYCEMAAAPSVDTAPDAPGTSIWGRMTAVFRRVIDEGEAHRLGHAPEHQHSRVRRYITRKLAEAVAEQRLLWHLRRETDARLVHPDDLAADRAMQVARQLITADRDKHRKRCVIDAVLLVLSAPVALVPGPNVLAYYFTFGTVGHFLSMKGADQGLSRVKWTTTPSAELTRLREALGLPHPSRRERVEQIADRLGLDRLAHFLDRVSDRAA